MLQQQKKQPIPIKYVRKFSEKLKISSSSRSQSLPVPPQQVSRVAAVATSGQNKLRSYCDKSNKLVVMKMMVVVKVKVKKVFLNSGSDDRSLIKMMIVPSKRMSD